VTLLNVILFSGIASVQIPTGPGVEDGIKAVEANMNLMKNSTYPLTILLLLKLFGLLPFAAYRQKPKVPPLFISALPGPKKAMFLAGNPITGLNFQMHLGGDFRKLKLSTTTRVVTFLLAYFSLLDLLFYNSMDCYIFFL